MIKLLYIQKDIQLEILDTKGIFDEPIQNENRNAQNLSKTFTKPNNRIFQILF